MFFSDLDVGAWIFQENVPIKIFNISLNAHRISNKLVPKIPAQRYRKKVVVSRDLIFLKRGGGGVGGPDF